MIRSPYLFTTLTGAIAICLLTGGLIRKSQEENGGRETVAPRKLSHLTASSTKSPRHQRSRSLRNNSPKYFSVNYSYLEQGLEISLPNIYGDYISGLGLSSYEARYFESLLVERLIAQQQFGLELITGDHGDRLMSSQKIAKRISENNSQIRGFLNHPEDYADFLKFEKQLPERRNMRKLRPLLAELTRETEERLIDLLYECRKEEEGDVPLWKSILPPKNLDRTFESWQRTDENLAQLIPTVLPNDLAQDFLNHWKTIREIQIEEIHLAYSLFPREG